MHKNLNIESNNKNKFSDKWRTKFVTYAFQLQRRMKINVID